jgi:hypothetical protein
MTMSNTPPSADAVQQRMHQIRSWLSTEGARHCQDQRHLDVGTPERAYWHLGYLAALTDTEHMLAVAPLCKEPK